MVRITHFRGRAAECACLLVSLMLSGCAFAKTDLPSRPAVGDGVVTLQDERIDESSGLARSGFDHDWLWTHNDSFRGAQLFVVSRQSGDTLAAYGLRNTFNIDWEDIAAFSDHGQPALLLADVGDNFAIRGSVNLYVVHEPDRLRNGDVLVPQRTLLLRYPDGPRDVEAVAVDEAARQVYLLSKRDAVPRLYRVSLDPPTPLTSQIAESLGPINIPRAAPGQRQARRINWVTAMDFDAAGQRAAVVTAVHVHVYDREADESWASAFQRAPVTMPLPRFRQIEGAALTADGLALDVSSERLPTPLARIQLPLPPPLPPVPAH
jgi:hypothetical protein